MKKLCLLSMSISILFTSCVLDSYVKLEPLQGPLTLKDAGVDRDETVYTSWVVLDNGQHATRQEVVLYYPQMQISETPPIVVSALQFRGVHVSEAVIGAVYMENITVLTYEYCCCVDYSQFQIPMSFTSCRAIWNSPEYRVEMPYLRANITISEPVLQELPDEVIDGKEYFCYSLTVHAESDYFAADKEVKLLVEKCPISFEVSVDGWKDGDVTVSI